MDSPPPYLRANRTRARLAALAPRLVCPQDTIPHEKRFREAWWDCLSKRGRERARRGECTPWQHKMPDVFASHEGRVRKKSARRRRKKRGDAPTVNAQTPIDSASVRPRIAESREEPLHLQGSSCERHRLSPPTDPAKTTSALHPRLTAPTPPA